jgi:hypothetical protein
LRHKARWVGHVGGKEHRVALQADGNDWINYSEICHKINELRRLLNSVSVTWAELLAGRNTMLPCERTEPRMTCVRLIAWPENGQEEKGNIIISTPFAFIHAAVNRVASQQSMSFFPVRQDCPLAENELPEAKSLEGCKTWEGYPGLDERKKAVKGRS